MTISRARMNIFVSGLQLCAIAFSFAPCDARTTHLLRGHSTKKIVTSKHLDLYNAQVDDMPSNTESYGLGSPFTIPPYDALPLISWPDQITPPLCIDSPTMPLPPPAASGGSGSGGGYLPLPPPSSSSNPTPTPTVPPFLNPPLGSSGPVTGSPSAGSNPSNPPSNPGIGSSPSEPNPPILTPSPSIPSPPYNYQPNPPTIVIPRPPSYNQPPSIFVPSPPVFQPPVVYPPPAVPPPPRVVHNGPLWCVAKPTVPDPIIQEAMNYACGSGGDCGSIQPQGLCFQPDTLYAHSSYAFNSYWQRTKVAGGTCDFGRTAMLVTVDPSYDGCHFVFF